MDIRHKYPFERPQLVAHRANYGDEPLPENTLIAVQIAHDNGMQWVECDVQLTADNELIVLHDNTLARTTDAMGEDAKKLVSEMTYAEILKYDAGIKYGDKFKGEKIPTLKQFLTLLQKLNMGLLLEIKPIEGYEIATAIKTIEVLRECNHLTNSKLLIQSFQFLSLQEVMKLDPQLNLGFIDYKWENIQEKLRELNCTAFVGYHEILSEENVKTIKNTTPASLLFAWTVNDKQKALELYRNGVDIMISDHPELIPFKSLRPAAHSILFQNNFHPQSNNVIQETKRFGY